MEMGITAIVSNADPAIPGDNITKPLISALLPLLASRYEGASRDKNVLDGDSTSPEPTGTPDDSTAGSSPGSILDGLGGLIEQFRRIGLGDTVDTWFKPGPNKRVAPNDIALVLGEDAIDELARRTGLSRGRVWWSYRNCCRGWSTNSRPRGSSLRCKRSSGSCLEKLSANIHECEF
jgi:uncharacterized protein YidB (DUF937 family)